MTNMARSVYFENSKIGDKIKLKIDGKDREFEISGFSEVVTSNGDTSNDMQIFTKSGLISPKSYTMYFKCKNVSKVEGTFETLMKQLEKAKKADAGSDEDEITGYIHSVLLKFYRRVTKPHIQQTFIWYGRHTYGNNNGCVSVTYP